MTQFNTANTANTVPHDKSVGSIRDDFYLTREWRLLNNGSYGACPKPVFEELQRWQLELEKHPGTVIGRWPEWFGRAGSDDLNRRARAVCDYIAGMTDRYAIEEHRRLFSIDLIREM